MLTSEQKAYADDIVQYMSSDMAKLGNEVSMRLYGIQKYNEGYYFPLKSANNFIYSEPGVENDSRIKHIIAAIILVPLILIAVAVTVIIILVKNSKKKKAQATPEINASVNNK